MRGFSDTEVNELTVSPAGAPSGDRPVTATTPLAKWLSTLRNISSFGARPGSACVLTASSLRRVCLLTQHPVERADIDRAADRHGEVRKTS
ncbi:hypothetical protein GCM10023336_65130 [Streptomyces similanensis]|uniref:Integrase n=1 Tax=Streptomyces similanensis TaxID=1274988 RepID=A0ABP9LF40_9ACTN